jgi:predicted MFS family arabinose efflux permease
VRWDRLTVGIALAYAVLSWSLGYGALLPQLRSGLTMSDTVASLHASFFGWALFVTAFGGAALVSRVGRHHLIGVAAALMGAGALVFGVGSSLVVTLSGAGITGLGAAVMVLVAPGLIIDLHPHDAAATTSTLNAIPMVAGLLLPLVIAGSVDIGSGWRWPYIVIGVAVAVGAVGCAAKSPPPIAVRGHRGSPVRELSDRAVRMAWLVLVLGIVLEIGTGFWAAESLHQLGGVSTSIATALLPVFFAAMMTGRLLMGRLVRRWGTDTVMIGGALIFVVGFVPFWLGPGMVVRVAGLLAMGCGISSAYPVGVTRLLLLGEAAVLGPVSALASAFGVTLGPLMLGVASDAAGLRWAQLVLPATAALLVMVLVISRSTPGSDARRELLGDVGPAPHAVAAQQV